MFKKILSAVIAITLVMGMCSCSEQASSQSAEPSITTASQKDPDVTQSEPSVIKTEPVEPPAESGRETVELTSNYSFVKTNSEQKNDADFLKGLSSFSVELFKRTVKNDLTNGGSNTLVSPESVAFAMGMTANGANGSTLRQMQDVLCKGVDIDKFNSNMNLLISKAHNSNTADSKLSIANSVWVRDKEGLTLNQQFVKNCKELYNAEMFRAPFDNKTVEALNGWVNDKTDKMIPKIIDRFTGNEVMCLVNCVAFDSKWEEEYTEKQEQKDQTFTNAKGQQVKCTMLGRKEDIYVENGRATGFVKNYKGGKYAFMAVLPNEGTDIGNYVASMSGDEITTLYQNRNCGCNVVTKLPEFTFDYSAEMGDTLAAMGMKEAFTNNADFSKMFENTSVAVNRVIHKTHIELDAKGTKAAAATAVTMRTNAVSVQEDFKKVILDRPFLFAIMDTESGLPVFIGTVCDPTVK